MKEIVYIKVEESPSSGYISIQDVVSEDNLKEAYQNDIENAKHFGFRKKVETFKGFKLQYILIEVKYDGRKGIKEEDVLQSLDNQDLVIQKGSSIFGGFYLPTEKLKLTLEDQLSKRKELINQGLYESIAWNHYFKGDAYMDYNQAKAYKQELNVLINEASNELNSFEKNEIGVIPDHVRVSENYQSVKDKYDLLFISLQNFNKWYVKKFKKEITVDRKSLWRILIGNGGYIMSTSKENETKNKEAKIITPDGAVHENEEDAKSHEFKRLIKQMLGR